MVALPNGDTGINPQDATIPEGDSDGDDQDASFSSSGGKPENGHAHSSSNSNNKKKNKKSKKKDANSAQPSTMNAPNRVSTNLKRRKKRNRVVRLANVADESRIDTGKEMSNDDSTPNTTASAYCTFVRQTPSIPLPYNHYKTVLYRRAIRKGSGSNPPSPTSGGGNSKGRSNKEMSTSQDNNNHQNVDEYGDISLGMKLSVVGGKVIVQSLNKLSDGRASPAQISGVIQRGDVLLSINNLSLVHLPIDLLMERLKPLSTPDPSGVYQRILHLRLAAGEGLTLLRKYEAAEARKANVSDEAATEVFSLFPMVDQLSGMPLFDNTNMPSLHMPPPPRGPHHNQHQEEKKQTEEDPRTPGKDKGRRSSEILTNITQKQQQQAQQYSDDTEESFEETISSDLAHWTEFDREKFMSKFFVWNDTYSELMRPLVAATTSPTPGQSTEEPKRTMTKSEMLELGRKALLGAKNLTRVMENIDKGKDMRSFRSWNSSISLRSRASTRRRYILDAVSLPVRCLPVRTADAKSTGTFGVQQEGGSLASSTGSKEESEAEEFDGDELLLNLAAHDEIWRSQVIQALEEARDNLDRASEEASETEDEPDVDEGIDSAMTEGLGAFLFGETMAKIVTKKKKSKALPPGEITAVLFDLSTNLVTTMPDEVGVGSGASIGLVKSTLLPSIGRKHPEISSSVILATRFVLDEALIVWLETFKPLPWESRRVLWPYATASPTSVGESQARSMFSDADSLTIDSGRASPSASSAKSNSTQNLTKDLRQLIEDQELDAETRAETCFLVTYYFTQRLLPKTASSRSRGEDNSDENNVLVDFVQKYGAYMKLHTCLAYAAALKCSDVIHELLELSEHDMRHRDVIKLFAKRNALILYEPTMLSAIVKCLPLIRKEPSAERRQTLVDTCVSAYPDLLPWQVKQALLEPQGNGVSVREDMKELFYYYLSSLLYPHEGSEVARHDPGLVEEWCILSLDESDTGTTSGANSRRQNFFSVASRSSSDHLAYHRDLVMLIKLSMANSEFDLALELAGEIVDSPNLSTDNSVVILLLKYLREIARDAINQRDLERQNALFRSLKRVIRLFSQMASLSRGDGAQSVSVPDELLALIEYKDTCSGGSRNRINREVLDLIYFLGKEAAPNDFLKAFSTWTAKHDALADTVHVLHSVLMRGSRLALNTELSGSLLRLRRARQRMNMSHMWGGQIETAAKSGNHAMATGQTIWSLMSNGLVTIDK